ncbi:hypothetical protein C9374_012279 [Naegleria lovaniensis]|uniref:SAM domain-containing protein n=1 Tax=Naegleria lovaniensis TaxID=51637 RepID=A0AA88G7I9_NAELO|nr:uncharacterized protein C9374_012279 [Naegleria lovaniensis]KAG2373290.1 hypothetical protein C9374_012279 [Naegleria lovaniensis]
MGNWGSWSEHGLDHKEDVEPSKWTNEMVLDWLSKQGFDDYKKHFIGVNGTVLQSLTKDTLVDEMNIPTGVAIKLMREVDRLFVVHTTSTGSGSGSGSPNHHQNAANVQQIPNQNNSTQNSNLQTNASNKSIISTSTITTSSSSSVNDQISIQQDDEEAIKKCLIKLDKLKGLQNLSEKQKRDKAKNLVIKHHLLNSYLNKDFVATKRTITELINDSPVPSSSPSTRSNSASSSSSYAASAIGAIIPSSKAPTNMIASDNVEIYDTGSVNDDEDKKDLQQVASEISELQTNKNYVIKDEEFLKVKLVVVELHRTAAQRNFRKFLSPVLDTFNVVPQFGLFHSALVVGPWYLEWNDSSLIVPRKCYSGAAVLAADVDRSFKGPQVGEALDKISNIICNWNSNMMYSQQKANCQHFVDEICSALGIELKFKGALGDYCEKLRTFGSCELNYTIPKELKEKCEFTQETWKFTSHAQLDDFVHTICKKDPLYFEKRQDDWSLLKSFDRAFWLRYYKNKKSEDFKPCSNGCPFSDPATSGSIMENFFTFGGKKR